MLASKKGPSGGSINFSCELHCCSRAVLFTRMLPRQMPKLFMPMEHLNPDALTLQTKQWKMDQRDKARSPVDVAS
eukprot:4395545-Amphidinium_carterae.1